MAYDNTHMHVYPLAIQAEAMADLIANYEEDSWHYKVVRVNGGYGIAVFDAEDYFLGYL